MQGQRWGQVGQVGEIGRADDHGWQQRGRQEGLYMGLGRGGCPLPQSWQEPCAEPR